MDESLITTREAAQISGYDSTYVRKLCRDRKIESKKFGWSLMISKSSLLEWMEKNPGRRVAAQEAQNVS